MYFDAAPFVHEAQQVGITILPYARGQNVTYSIPHFGTLTGTSFDVAAIASALDTTISMCFGTLYTSSDMFCSSDQAAVRGTNNQFQGTVDRTRAVISFSEAALPGAYVTDPFGNANACAPMPAVGHYACKVPRDLALRVNPTGLMLVWDTSFMHTGLEASVVALAGVVALAVVLPYSKSLNAGLGCTFDDFFGPRDGWMASVVSDVIVATAWLSVSIISRHGVATVANPLYRTVVSHDVLVAVAAAKMVCIVVASTMASFFLLARKHMVETRTSAEVALLMAISALSPLHAAPEFHALLEACTSAAALIIVSRDLRAAKYTVSSVALFCLVAGSCMLGFVPVFVGSNAVPHGVEVAMSACVTVQMVAYGHVMRTPSTS